jgi:hypothetical protein
MQVRTPRDELRGRRMIERRAHLLSLPGRLGSHLYELELAKPLGEKIWNDTVGLAVSRRRVTGLAAVPALSFFSREMDPTGVSDDFARGVEPRDLAIDEPVLYWCAR